jgi:hypothetical protein
MYAESFRIRRKLDKLLEGIAYAWESFGFERHPEARYDGDSSEVRVQVKGGRREGELDVHVWYEGDQEEGETYLLVGWYGRGRREAQRLADEAATVKELKLPGVLPPSRLNDREWYVRELRLGGLEHLEPSEQWNRVVDFLKETVAAVEHSGIL